jgi:hypothetical protein
VTEDLEQTARRIAERGPEMLTERIRAAFEEATAVHEDALTLQDEQLEQMAQRAADRADGMQWRRALAAVATQELGIGLGEALSHPAVVRAHAILGAPSYEEGLARLGPLPVAGGHAAEEPEDVEPAEPEDAALLEPVTPAEEPEAELDHHEPRPDPSAPLRVTGTHLGGIADLASPEHGVELWFSEEGLDIIRPTSEPLGRLSWGELQALEVPQARGRFVRRRRLQAYLVVRGRDGDASFEIPGLTPDELRQQLAPLME